MKFLKKRWQLCLGLLLLLLLVWYLWPVRCTATLQLHGWDQATQQPTDRTCTMEIDMKICRSLLADWSYQGTCRADGVEFEAVDNRSWLIRLQDRKQGRTRDLVFGRREGESPAGTITVEDVQYGFGKRTIRELMLYNSYDSHSGFWCTDWDWFYGDD